MLTYVFKCCITMKNVGNDPIIQEVTMLKTDVLVIGAGAVGNIITRELTKYNLDVICVDKREDVGGDCSKSNSAIIHTGYDAKPGTLESELVVSANPQYPKLCKDLDIPFEMIGAILPASPRNSLHSFPVLKKSV